MLQPIPPVIQQQLLDVNGGDTATNSQATAATTRPNMRWIAAEEEVLINAVKDKWDVLNATKSTMPIDRVWDQIFKEYYEKQSAGQPRRSRNTVQIRGQRRQEAKRRREENRAFRNELLTAHHVLMRLSHTTLSVDGRRHDDSSKNNGNDNSESQR
ncbi:hypothetical protein BX666DRAFT_2122452 [Dichotomocladium elegans]|nr:hypothetical protein BX666DRAFT_2122452 [Dichotomocladium elegans]